MNDFLYKDTLYVVEGTNVQQQDKFKADMREFLCALGKKVKSCDKNIKISIDTNNPVTLELDNYKDTHPSYDCGQVNIRSEIMGLNLELKMRVLLRSGYHNYLNIDYVEYFSINDVEFSKSQDSDYVIDLFMNDCMSEDMFDEALLIANKTELNDLMTNMRMLSTEVFDYIGNNLGSRYLRVVEDSKGQFPYIKSDIQVSDAEILIID